MTETYPVLQELNPDCGQPTGVPRLHFVPLKRGYREKLQ
jgi:hypothetical protein